MATKKTTTATKTKTATKKAVKEPPMTKSAEGAVAVGSPYLLPTRVSAENVPGFIANIHISDLMNNLTKQVYSQMPEVWVEDAEGNRHEGLTEWMNREFERLGCWNLMKYVIPDTYYWGCFAYSVGYGPAENGGFEIKEIRHLPAESFCNTPTIDTSNLITPNPLMPGIVTDSNGNVQVWQTYRRTGMTYELHNVSFVRASGTPFPSGAAYLYPCYFLVARMDFASQAQIQQVSRIGAPRMIPKVKDDISTEEYQHLIEWHRKAGKFWEGKNNSILIPPGIEFPSLNISENQTATEFINQCVEWIRTYGNPMSDLTSTGGLGQSDSGRMEMWVNFISSEQTLAEKWLCDIFTYVLKANGWTDFEAHIELKRPSIDRSSLKLTALNQAVASKAITAEEIRDNLTDILELKEWSPEIEAQLKTLQEQTQLNPYQMAFGNSAMGSTIPTAEQSIMQKTEKELEAVYTDGMQKILAELDKAN